MNTKNDFRQFFASCKGYIVFKPFLKENDIAESSFSKFLKDELFNYTISIEKLQGLYDSITAFCEKIA